MCSDVLNSTKFADFLFYCDQDLARQTSENACPYCKGKLHVANYQRKPRGGGPELGEAFYWRMSFCCANDECRKRTTPPSIRFLGRRVYLGAVTLLATCMQQGLSDQRIACLGLHLTVPRRTLKRWRSWWLKLFVQTRFWQDARAQLMPPVDVDALPKSLLERFIDPDLGEQLVRLLKFLSPLSTRNHAHAI